MKAETVFAQQLAACLQRVASIGIAITTELCIGTVQKCWTRCRAAGVIGLNRKLTQAPRLLIDYVIIHALYHLKKCNHSAVYYRFLDRTLPQWCEHETR